MARPKKADRCNGPYRKGAKWILRFHVADGTTHQTYASEEAANAAKAAFYKALALEDRTIDAAIERYADHMRRVRENKSGIVATTKHRLRAFFAAELHEPISGIDAARAARMYASYRARPTRTGRPPAAATHRNTLKQVKTFVGWCQAKRWIRPNPFADVQPTGRARRGKKKLRIDEVRRLLAHCFAVGSEPADAVAITFVMGFRAGETLGLRARDLDDDGRLLWVDDADDDGESHLKTEDSRRCVAVPQILGPVLERRAGAVDEPNGKLFGGRSRHWLLHHVKRLCREAEVPEVSTHGLRATHSELAHQAGASAEVVAGSLGQTVAVNHRHYTSPAAVREQGQRVTLERVFPVTNNKASG